MLPSPRKLYPKGECHMLMSLPATIDADGTVRLLETVHFRGFHRAIVTILDEPADRAVTPEGVLGDDAAARDDNIVRETAGIWAGRHGDGLDYVTRLRAEWDAR